ncbi:uncharacterized protein [Blastocystis hominis]|uniref:Uncharacterized protein n=1 Tax=Blastocystis hominis TaxID=12968 RepID=D8LUQ1_BLAHO|nr:uncharacterized protein [Blastocystis hominis]CBK19540.2 unnamed protein product [Blastocystis hominis]|eukprot:XP_012893588.1 uncharacterized protein [Blastocystis hominis]
MPSCCKSMECSLRICTSYDVISIILVNATTLLKL